MFHDCCVKKSFPSLKIFRKPSSILRLKAVRRTMSSYLSESMASSDRILRLPNADIDIDKWNHCVSIAADMLKHEGIIGVPTDTIYGIAARAQSAAAIDSIYSIKRRDPKKPIAVCFSDINEISHYAKLTISDETLQELLPGPVTLCFTRTPYLNPLLNPSTTLVGIRIPNYSFLRCVARLLKEPIALTSANISSEKSPLVIDDFRSLWPSLSAVFDGGQASDSNLGSTVVDLSNVGFYSIVREGCALSQTVQTLEKHGLKPK